MKIHRCRFVDYVPSAINCACFVTDKPSTGGVGCLAWKELLVVGRENGDVEVFDAADQMNFDTKLCTPSSVQGIACPSVDLIVTAHLDGYLRLWNRQTKALIHQTESLGGSIWCIDQNLQEPNLIACGCDDGSVRIFDVSQSGFSYIRSCDIQEGKILGLKWNANGTKIAACSSTGFLNIFTSQTGVNIKRICVSNTRIDNVILWSLAWIDETDGVACGDSTGHVSIWSTSTGTLIQKLATHKADVLAIAFDSVSNSIYASGVDSSIVRIANLGKLKDETLRNSSGEPVFRTNWTISNSFSSQAHDVKVLLAFKLQNNSNMLIAGGLDAHLYLYWHTATGKQRSQVISHLNGQRKMISCAKSQHLFAANMGNFVAIWGLQNSESKLLGKICTPNNENIMEVALSESGAFLVVSTATQTLFYRLQVDLTTFICSSIERISSNSTFPSLCQLKFCGTSLLYALNQADNSIVSLNISSPVTINRTWNLFPDRVVTYAINSQRDLFAVQLESKTICIYSTNSNDNPLFKLPKCESRCKVLEFIPETRLLFACMSNNAFSIYDMDKGGYSDWSSRNPSENFPAYWTNSGYKIQGIVFPKKSKHFYLWSNESICRVDLSKNLKSSDKKNGLKRQHSSKNSTQIESKLEHDGPFTITKEFNAILGVAAMHDQSFIVVERPWIDICRSLPPAFQKKKFGK